MGSKDPYRVNWGLTKRPMLSELILGRIPKNCCRCGEPTVWRAKGQRDLGFCATHALAEPVSMANAVETVMTYLETDSVVVGFEGDRSVLTSTPVRVTLHWHTQWAPRQYLIDLAGPDAGPCLGCHQPVRRYGPDFYAYCKGCRP